MLVLLLAGAIAMLIRHRRAAARARRLWREQSGPRLEHATTTAGVLAAAAVGGAQISEASEAVRRAGEELDQLAASAPTDEAGAAAAAVAARLRSVLFDVEADAVLRGSTPGAPVPSGPAAVDPELARALTELRVHVERATTPQS